jgi:2-polyprenyl-3-methyl-5-hydroxy-6-metoxy-1,4-benzoquinol methylase
MVTCCHCEGLESQFDRRTAEHELRRFRRRGPTRSTQILIDELRAAGVDGASLIDIGGGVGAIHHALLDAGASTATHVDISSEYIAAAREEAVRRGHDSRVLFVRGDFVQLAPQVPAADVVTLDRVICCYPDMEALVGNAAEKARRLFGAVYPPDTWWMRMTARAINALLRLRRSAFRVYVHTPAAIDEVLRRHGLERVARRRTALWEIATYARRGAS